MNAYENNVLARIEDLDKGKIVGDINGALAEVAKAMHAYIQQTKDARCKGGLVVKIDITPTKDAADTSFEIDCTIKKSIPQRRRHIAVSQREGKLLIGADDAALARRSGEDEVPIYDLFGNKVGVVDPKTGEEIRDTDTAGSIAPSA